MNLSVEFEVSFLFNSTTVKEDFLALTMELTGHIDVQFDVNSMVCLLRG